MIVWYTLLYILINTLIVLGAILAAVLIILVAAMWSSVKADIAADNNKAIITLSIWHIIRRTIEIPFKDRDKPKSVSQKDGEEEEAHTVSADKPKKKSRFKKFLSGGSDASLKDDLKTLWNREYNVFDFNALHSLIIKYAEILSDYKYGLNKFFGHLRYKIRVDRLDVYIKYGAGEPDKTGIAYGLTYAGFESVVLLINKYIKTKQPPMLYLDPDYVNRVFKFEVGSVIKIRSAHIAHSVIIAFVSYVLRKKQRVKKNKESI